MSAVEIVMPRLSDAMEQGTIVRCLKNVGDQVEIGDELVEVETTLACDHRAVYGADGAAFLARLRALLESPEVLVL